MVTEGVKSDAGQEGRNCMEILKTGGTPDQTPKERRDQ